MAPRRALEQSLALTASKAPDRAVWIRQVLAAPGWTTCSRTQPRPREAIAAARTARQHRLGLTETMGHRRAKHPPSVRPRWKITPMSGTNMVPALITGSAVVVGALAGGTISALSTWASSRRSRKGARDDRRRAAYAAFIAAQEELRRVILAWKAASPPPTADSQFGPAVAQAVGSVDRAFVAVTLAGPEKAQDRADDVRGKAWGVYNVIYRPESPGQPVMPKFAERVGDYIDACDQFTQTASEVLHTR